MNSLATEKRHAQVKYWDPAWRLILKACFLKKSFKAKIQNNEDWQNFTYTLYIVSIFSLFFSLCVNAGEAWILESGRPEFKSHLHHLIVARTWASSFVSLSSNYLTCKRGILSVSSKTKAMRGLNAMASAKHLAQCLTLSRYSINFPSPLMA